MAPTDIETDYALERLVEAKGIALTKKGSKLVGRCPFCDHDADALQIDPKANTWICTGGCGDGGVVDWVSKSEGISPSHAEALLRADFEPTGGVAAAKSSTTTKLPALIQPDEPDAVVLRKVLGYYHRALVGSPEAMEWLRDRGLRDPEMITHFHLGLADRTLGYRLPRKNRQAGKAVREQLRRLGILRQSGHEQFRGSLVVPFFDDDGNLVNVYGHKLGGANLRSGTAIETWLTEESVGVLNPEGFIEGQKLILTGSVLDALTWWSWGFRFVSTTMGRDTLPEGVSGLLVARNIRSVALALPRNDTAIETLASELRDLGVEVHRIVLPKEQTANDIARQADDPRDALHKLLRAANWVSPPRPSPPPTTPPRPDHEPAERDPEDHQLTVELGDRRWRVRGLDKLTSHGSLRVNLLVSKGEAAAFHIDVIELYSARQRRSFLSAAASELNVEERVLKKDIGTVLLRLEALVDDRLRQDLAPGSRPEPEIDEPSRQAALAFLRRPDLFDQILADFEALGVVGEESNKLVAYLAATSRKLDHPLAVLIQSSSAAGKSSLMDAVLRLFPSEDKLSFSAMTGRSLYYLGEQELAHKVLSIAEEEGASDAAYALKILQSEGRLTIASTGKESKTGRLTTQTYEVAGPVALLLTTTAIDIDEELLSRCIVLAVDEGREQTRAIHSAQRHRRTLDDLPPGTRRLLGALHRYVTDRAEAEGIDPCDLRFTRRELREALTWGNTQIKVHLRRLVDFEYVVVHRSGHGQRVAYELVYNGEGTDGEPFLPGLGCDATTGSGRGQEAVQPGRGRHEAGGKSAGSRGGRTGPEPASEEARSGAGS